MAEVADRHGGKAVNIDELAGTEAYGNYFQNTADSHFYFLYNRDKY
jgi:hypothetical protein